MAKTVTLQRARTGRRSVTVDGRRFALGEAVPDVPEPTIKKLKALPGVQVHVTAAARPTAPDEPDPSTTPDEPPEAQQ